MQENMKSVSVTFMHGTEKQGATQTEIFRKTDKSGKKIFLLNTFSII